MAKAVKEPVEAEVVTVPTAEPMAEAKGFTTVTNGNEIIVTYNTKG